MGLAKETKKSISPEIEPFATFNNNSRMMLLLRQIRDASHDFSLGYNLREDK